MKKISIISEGRSALEKLQPVLTTLAKFGYEVFISSDGKDAFENTALVIIDVCGSVGGEFRDFVKKFPVAPSIVVGCGECEEKEFVWHKDQRAILARALQLLGEEEIAKLLLSD